jgi:signal peptidase II
LRQRRIYRSPLALVLIGLAVVLFDQLSKYVIVRLFAGEGYGRLEIIGDWLRLSFATNTGAAFGVLPQQTGLFVIVAAIVVPALFYFYVTLPHTPWFVRLSFGLLLGGTLGNLIDRVRMGYVVDFVDFGIGNLRWPSFNVADASFVVGTIVVAAYVLFWQQEEPQPQQTQDGAPGA